MNLFFLILASIAFNLSAKELPPIIKTCNMCHSDEAVLDNSNYPSLNQQTETYIKNTLVSFQDRTRHNPGSEYMYGDMSLLNEEEFKTVLSYYQSQPTMQYNVSDQDILNKGREIYFKGIPNKKIKSCSLCHGDNGEGSDDNPRLAGLAAYYQIKQAKAMMSGQREEAKVMSKLYKNISVDELKAVSIYLSSLK
jgi:cytochrome c553